MKRPNRKTSNEGARALRKCPAPGVLRDLILKWKKNKRDDLYSLLDGFESISFTDALKAAAAGVYPPGSDKAGKRRHHQRHLRYESTKQWVNVLCSHKTKIKSFSGQPFEKLFDFLDGYGSRVWGIGPVMVYDTALCIGANIGCLPKDRVYLHAGARLPFEPLAKRYIERDEAVRKYKELQQMNAYETESFLCVFQEEITTRFPRRS